MSARRWLLAAVVASVGAGMMSLAGAAFGAQREQADLLLVHGHIYTGTLAAPWVQALSVTASRIDVAGSDAAVLARKGPTTRVIDLGGRTVIPGIVDAHIHVWLGAIALHGVNLSTPAASITPSKPKLLLARFRAYAAQHPHEKIIFGRADFSPTPPPAVAAGSWGCS